MKPALLRSYEGQIKIVLVLLVLFLAVAIYLNIHLLLLARNAVQEEVGRRLGLEADLVRVELERDQMLRGVSGEAPAAAYIPPTYLDRMARLRGMVQVEILGLDGRVVSSSSPARVGLSDPLLRAGSGAALTRLRSGGSVIAPLDRAGGSGYATLAVYRPIQGRSRATVAVIKLVEEVPALSSVDFNLRFVAALQAGGLLLLLVLVIIFARWLLQPYRRLAQAAGAAPGLLAGPSSGGDRDEPDDIVDAFRGVLDRLRDQERELQRLKEERGGTGAALPGDRLVRGLTSAVLVFDRDGRLTVLNAAAEALLGVDRHHAVGRWHDDLLSGNGRLVDLVARSLREGESHSREVVVLTSAAGRQTHLGAMISPIRPDGTGPQGPADGVVCLLADLTEIKALRERVGLKENLASLGEMSAGIAHEFRNSLAAIQGYARLIARNGASGGAAAPAFEHAEAILREVGGIGKVVDDFLRYARPARLDLSAVDPREMVEDAVADLGADPLASGVRISIEGTFPGIVADRSLLRQALQNLLRNAAESLAAGRSDGDGAGGAAPQIVVRGAAAGDPPGGIRLVVEDNGPGIAPADLPHIFTPFFTTKDRGTGLGLALVQKTAVVHDGRVEVESEEGRGARFTLILPPRPGAAVPATPLA